MDSDGRLPRPIPPDPFHQWTADSGETAHYWTAYPDARRADVGRALRVHAALRDCREPTPMLPRKSSPALGTTSSSSARPISDGPLDDELSILTAVLDGQARPCAGRVVAR